MVKFNYLIVFYNSAVTLDGKNIRFLSSFIISIQVNLKCT